jgi:GT2 family glycosyltransferase
MKNLISDYRYNNYENNYNYIVIVVNYNNSNYTIKLYESIKNIDHLLFIIVDNNSSSVERSIIEKLACISNIIIIFNSSNLGYFPGINKGIELIRKEKILFDFLIIGNNDLLFSQKFFDNLSQIGSKIDKYPVISPRIININCKDQNPHVKNKVSKVRQWLYKLYYSNYTIAKIIMKIKNITGIDTSIKDYKYSKISGEIFQGYGACYILTRHFFDFYEYLWCPSIIMGEELFLAMQINKIGYKIYYVPDLEVYHVDHATTKNIGSKEMWFYEKEAFIKAEYFKKNNDKIAINEKIK